MPKRGCQVTECPAAEYQSRAGERIHSVRKVPDGRLGDEGQFPLPLLSNVARKKRPSRTNYVLIDIP